MTTPKGVVIFMDWVNSLRTAAMGPRTAGRRICAVQAFSPEAKTLAEGQFTCPEHFNYRRVEPPSGRRNPKRKTRHMSCLSFWVPPPGGRLHPSVIKMLGASELPLRQGFRLWRKRLYGANAPPRCAGPHGRCPQTVHPVHKNDHTFRCGHFYGYRRKLNCSGGINPPCAKVWAFSPKRLWGTPHR